MARAKLDHFVYAVPDLDVAIRRFELDTGVKPLYGGRHLLLGTHNALVALDDGVYFELVAADPGATEIKLPMLKQLKEPSLIAWAVQCDGLEELEHSLATAPAKLGPVGRGSRVCSDGSKLNYKHAALVVDDKELLAALPFVVDWLDSAHPSQTSPQGCRLRSFEIHHPHEKGIESVLNALGATDKCKIVAAAVQELRLEIETPRGVRSFR